MDIIDNNLRTLYWLGIWECAPPQSFRFDSLWCQFEGVSLASSKKKKKLRTLYEILICQKCFSYL